MTAATTRRRPAALPVARLLEFANTRPDPSERESLIDLAGKWKHGYIPLDAIAYAIKMKHQQGDGKRRRGIARGSQANAHPYQHGGASTSGKSRLDPKGAAAHSAIVSGSRRKAAPPSSRGLRSPSRGIPGVDDRLPGTPAEAARARALGKPTTVDEAAKEAVRLPKSELHARAAAGDKIAQAELGRRAARRTEKHAAAQAELKGIAEHPELQGKPGQPWPTGTHKAPETPAAPKAEHALPTAKPQRKPSALYQEFRAEREQQDRRFEQHARGGVGIGDTGSQEYKDYFGVGDHSTTPVEERLTFAKFREQRASGKADEKHQALSYKAGVHLGKKHGLEGQQPHHDAEFDKASAGQHEEMFNGGYTDGLIAAESAKEKRAAAAEARKAARTVKPREPDAGSATRIEQNRADHPLGSRVSFKEGSKGPRKRGTVVGHDDRGVQVKRDGDTEPVSRLADDLKQVRPEGVPAGYTENPAARRARIPVENMSMSDLQQERDHPLQERRTRAAAELKRREDAKAAGSPRKGLTSYRRDPDAPGSTPTFVSTRVDAPPVASLDAKRAENAARTPRQIGEAVASDPSRVSTEDLQRIERLGGRYAPAAEAELSRRREASAPRTPQLTERFNPSTGKTEKFYTPSVHKEGNSWVAQHNDGEKITSVRVPHNPSLGSMDNRTNALKALQSRVNGARANHVAATGADPREAQQFPSSAEGLARAGIKVGDTVKVSKRSFSQGKVSDPVEQPGTWTVDGLSRNGQVRVKDTEHGTTMDADPGMLRRQLGNAPTTKADPSEPRAFGAAANSGQRANVGEAQASARAAARKSTPPVQGEMFGAHGEQQPDMFGSQSVDASGKVAAVPGGTATERAAEHLKGVDTATLRGMLNDRRYKSWHGVVTAELSRRDKLSGPSPKAEAAAKPAAPGIRVEHSGDGTVVYGTEKGDTEATSALKDQGFKWSRSLGGWYLPRTWSEPTREQRVRGLESKLGDKVSVERGPVARTGTAAERAQARIDRAAELEAQHAQRAERKATEADVKFGRARAIGDMIPMGQPILVGHHSEGRHRSDLAKIDRNMRAGSEAHAESEQAAARSSAAAARGRMETDPRAAARRLDRNEAELRSVQRKLNGTGKEIHGENVAASGEYADRLRAREQELTDQVAHDRGIAGDRVGPAAQFGKHNLAPGDVVTVGGRQHVVHSTGPKNAKLMTEVGPLPYAYHQIGSVAKLDDMSTDALKRTLVKSQDATRFGSTRRALPPAIVARIESILRSREAG